MYLIIFIIKLKIKFCINNLNFKLFDNVLDILKINNKFQIPPFDIIILMKKKLSDFIYIVYLS